MEISVRENQIVFDEEDPDTGNHYLDQELVKDIFVGIQDKALICLCCGMVIGQYGFHLLCRGVLLLSSRL